MSVGSFALLDLVVVLIIASALGYLLRYRMQRPPVGRFNRSDVVIMSCLLAVLPFGYLAMPPLVVSGVFAVMFLGIGHMTLSPVVGGRLALAAGAVIVAATATAGFLDNAPAVLALNCVVILVALVGVTNLWTQTGMTAAHVVGLSTVLIGYDLIATGFTSVTDRFLDQVNGLPFAPLLAVTTGSVPVAAGLGDCLMLTLWPLVATKAYGRAAGAWGVIVGMGLLVAVQSTFVTGAVDSGVPFMIILGPAIIVQHLIWRKLRGAERRTGEWSGATHSTPDTTERGSQLSQGLVAVRGVATTLPGTWVAVHAGEIVGEGPTPGSARRAARQGGCTEVPVIVMV